MLDDVIVKLFNEGLSIKALADRYYTMTNSESKARRGGGYCATYYKA